MVRGSVSLCAYRTAAHAAVPAEPPTSRPSSRARRRAMVKESRSLTLIISSTSRRSKVFGMKSSPIPSTL